MSDSNNNGPVEEPPCGILATSSTPIGEEDVDYPKVKRTGDPVMDRVRLLFYLHSDTLGIDRDNIDELVKDEIIVDNLLRRLEQKQGVSIDFWENR